MCHPTAGQVEEAHVHLENHDHLAILGQEIESVWG